MDFTKSSTTAENGYQGKSGKTNYVLPSPLAMLSKGKEYTKESTKSLEQKKQILQHTLESFAIDGKVTGVAAGPRVTRFEILLAPGVKSTKVVKIEENIAMAMETENIRILQIPGHNAVGVEIPNSVADVVCMRDIIETDQWQNSKYELPVVLGTDVVGKPVILDLGHLLISGGPGSGKSVCMNTLIMSLLFKFSPEELRMIMIDPKIVDMATYASLPHLLTPVINNAHKASLILSWAVNEMEKRFRLLAKAKRKDIAGFNSRQIEQEPMLDDNGVPVPEKLPFLVIIIDELADIMMSRDKNDAETHIARIAQQGRAAGIHMVIATQRPSINIITCVIRANMWVRIAFKVGSIIDSRVLLEEKGAERLLGRGDMLFMPQGSAYLERIQGAIASEQDIIRTVEFISSQSDQVFDQNLMGLTSKDDIADSPLTQKYIRPGDDNHMRNAISVILTERKAGVSFFHRRLDISYKRAAKIMDSLEQRGLVGKPEILVHDEANKE